MKTRYHLTHTNETICFNEIIVRMIREIRAFPSDIEFSGHHHNKGCENILKKNLH
jgi:hypothetical protein